MTRTIDNKNPVIFVWFCCWKHTDYKAYELRNFMLILNFAPGENSLIEKKYSFWLYNNLS
jgi:hypothetical protein